MAGIVVELSLNDQASSLVASIFGFAVARIYRLGNLKFFETSQVLNVTT